MRLPSKFFCLLLALCATGPGFAETLYIPLGSQGGNGEPLSLPQKGQSMSSVRESLGAPARELPPVGNPPITVWDYGEFRVFFEYQHVIDAVKKHRPRHPEAVEE